SSGNNSDNIARLRTYRVVEGYPLIVTIGVSTAEIFAGVNLKRRAYNIIGSILTFVILLVTGFTVRGRMLLQDIAGHLRGHIAEQKRAQSELDRTKKFLDTVVENIPIAIAVKELKSSKIIHVNRANEILLGKPRDQTVGKTTYELFAKEKAELIAKYDQEAIRCDGQPNVVEIQLPTINNGLRLCTMNRLVVRDNADTPQYLIVVTEDITERKAAETQIAYMAHHDPLTALSNRALFHEELDGALTTVAQGAQLAVLF